MPQAVEQEQNSDLTKALFGEATAGPASPAKAPRNRHIWMYIKAMQTPEGNWQAFESRRPPMNIGLYQTAALAIDALKTYGPPAEKADRYKRNWLPRKLSVVIRSANSDI